MGRGIHTVLRLEILKGRDYSEELAVDGKVLEWILGKEGG
jgi:hypothetical protein